MNGKGFLLDTNAIIQLLKGNKGLLSIISGADFIATSIISEMEYFSFSGLSEEDVLLYQKFRYRIHVYGVPSDDPTFTCLVVSARKKYGKQQPFFLYSHEITKPKKTVLKKLKSFAEH